ncbi:MAG TPA: polysaccharide deacetylase family protein [Patescibacteria group bacterium]|jgi:peptidoglycan/xylan/chitin deacetylase (PgdA/CDA1 family)|nr:polysaccharide deacetylase family protein [Patescibacteria group bacterium]
MAVKRKTKVRRQQNNPWSKLISLGLLALILLGVFSIVISSNRVASSKSADLSFRAKTFFSPLRYTPLISPYPDITITPTPIPLTGFCLHVPVLMYHHIQPESVAKELGQTSLTVDSGVFDQQMAYLASSGYTPVWASELINALLTHSQLPGKPVVVTMDDGYADNDIYALPVLQKYGIKANLMLASGLVGGNPDMLTWDQVNQMKGSGLIYFTNHTWSHYAISNGPQSKIESEIDVAQGQIQDHTGQTINVFTYPYGSFNNNSIQTLQQKGYIGAFTEIPGQYQCDSFIMTLHRTRIGNGSLASYGL